MRNTEEIKMDILQLFEDDNNLFCEVIEEVDGINGCLGENRYSDMDEIDDLFSPMDALRAAFYGYDEGEDGAPFCPNRSYFYDNGCGGIVSTDHKEYSDWLTEDFVDDVIRYRENIYIDDDELNELLNEYEEAGRAEEE